MAPRIYTISRESRGALPSVTHIDVTHMLERQAREETIDHDEWMTSRSDSHLAEALQ